MNWRVENLKVKSVEIFWILNSNLYTTIQKNLLYIHIYIYIDTQILMKLEISMGLVAYIQAKRVGLVARLVLFSS